MGINELLGNVGSGGGGNELVFCLGKEVIYLIILCYGKCCKFLYCGLVLV